MLNDKSEPTQGMAVTPTPLPLTIACNAPIPAVEFAPHVIISKAAVDETRASNVLLDQYYTPQDVADTCYAIFKEHFDPDLGNYALDYAT